MADGRPRDPLLRRRLDVGGGAWRQGEYDGAMRGLWFVAANVEEYGWRFWGCKNQYCMQIHEQNSFIYYYTFHTPHVYI
jgi:hypothetical protein